MSFGIFGSARKNGKIVTPLLLRTVVVSGGLVLGSHHASAQMANEPWGFQAQNRASIAALMRQVENEDNAVGAGSTSYSNDVLVCGGGGGSASATGNSTCIILNNANAALDIGQDSQGNQDSSNTNPDDNPQSPADDVLAALGEDD